MRADVAALVAAAFGRSQKDQGGGEEELDAEDRYLLERTYNEYRQSGAALTDAAQRARLQAVRVELDALRLAAQKASTDVDDGIWLKRSELPGVANTTLGNLKTEKSNDGDAAEDQLQIPLHGAVSEQIMRNAILGNTRHKLSIAVRHRFPENVERLEKILALRHEAAELLGFANHASLRMGEKIAESVNKI